MLEDKASSQSESDGFKSSEGSSSSWTTPILNGLGKLNLRRSKSPWLSTVGVSVLAAGIGGLVQQALLGASTPRFPYLTFYPVVIVAALVGKWPCGLLTVIFSALLVHAVFVPLLDSTDWFGLLFFIVNISCIVVVLELFTRYRFRALVAEATQSLDAGLAAIVQSSSDAIISETLDGTITSWNAGATRIFGYSAEEMIGQSITRIIPPDHIEEGTTILARLKAGERVENFDTLRRAKDGRKLDVSLAITPLKNASGAIIGASKFCRDITERKHAERALVRSEAALRENEERLRIALEAANLGSWDLDLTTGKAARSLRHDEIFGYPEFQPEWSAKVAAQHMLPEDKPIFEKAFARSLQTGDLSFEARVRWPDESVHWIAANGRAFYDDEGRAVRLTGVVAEITGRKDAESRLAAAKAEAERANLAKSKFLAAASHDLRQPVQSLTLLMGVIKRQAKDRPKVVELADMAQASVTSLNGMLTGILDISRLDAGVISPVMTSADIGELVEWLAREYQTRAASDGLDLRYSTRSLCVRTDATLLERIVRNLIENALRYTAKGGVLVGVRQKGDFVRLDVIDTGVGIPADQQAEIFEEFHQLNNPARDSSKGLGLGLAIVSRLANLLGIKVEVASRLGRGTRFSLLLPLARSEIAIKEVDLPLFDTCGRILIIEDNSDVRHAYELMLSDWGYETISAASGEDALDRAAHENWRFDAILADHRLGVGLTGTAASTEISRRANRPFPTLVLTGDTAKERIDEIQASGFVMLHKPVEADDLHRTLASLLKENVRSWSHGAA